MRAYRLKATGAALALCAMAPSIAAAAALPILDGRWSSRGCEPGAGTRWFSAGSTASENDICRVAVTSASGTVFHIHLACRYGGAHADTDDAVIAVDSPSTLRWIDQCMETRYRFCDRGARPAAFSVPLR